MAYITLANFKRIVPDEKNKKELLSKIELPPIMNIYPDERIGNLLELKELRQLYFSKLLLSQSEQDKELLELISSKKLVKVITLSDDYRKVYPPHPPKIHVHSGCKALEQNYLNYTLPDDFKEKYEAGGN